MIFSGSRSVGPQPRRLFAVISHGRRANRKSVRSSFRRQAEQTGVHHRDLYTPSRILHSSSHGSENADHTYWTQYCKKIENITVCKIRPWFSGTRLTTRRMRDIPTMRRLKVMISANV